ncbi:MAG: sigma 54-interacting transcriptional regulator [Gemmatimonadetes bacterium]|nr:sigma 54-interacting transcriptional regulator [Gemmatimonadota bacterium]
MRSIWRLVKRFAGTDIPLLLEGETGTGKELFAKAIHQLSHRSSGPFAPLNCAGLPEALLESELFGYERGAFTGAAGTKPGLFEFADGGTVFLDEVGELPLQAQAKLLRAVETRSIVRLGSRQLRPKVLDFRVVSATNRNLEEAVRRGEFRRDLYHRLSGVVIELPALRERVGDVEHLARSFLARYREVYGKPRLELAPATLEAFQRSPWPGNVRELEHAVAAAAAATDAVIEPQHLGPQLRRRLARMGEDAAGPGPRVEIRVRYPCSLATPVDLKQIKAEIARDAEAQVVAAARRLHHDLTREELAQFLAVDAKTLRHMLRFLQRAPAAAPREAGVSA